MNDRGHEEYCRKIGLRYQINKIWGGMVGVKEMMSLRYQTCEV